MVGLSGLRMACYNFVSDVSGGDGDAAHNTIA